MSYIKEQLQKTSLGDVKYTGDSFIAKKLSGRYKEPLEVDAPTRETMENIQRYNLQLQNHGIQPPKSKQVLGTVNKILDVLRTGEYAIGGLMAGEGIIKGIQEKISPSDVFGITPKETESFWDVFKQPAFYGALAVDILFDPITYLTFGFGGGAKIATKVGQKTLNKAGKSLLKKASKQFGEDSARRMMATNILRESGEKYLSKGGLRFMGRQILPRRVVQAPFKGIDWGLERLPLTGKAYKGTKDLMVKAFEPFKNINKVPYTLGGNGKFESMVLKTQKGIRGEGMRQLKIISELGKEARKKGLKNPGREIMAAVEFDMKTGNRILDDIADYMVKSQKRYGFIESAKGILPADSLLPKYMRHTLTKEGREVLEQGGKKVRQEFLSNVKKFRVSTPFAKGRKYKNPVTEINNVFKNKHGVNLFEEDAFKAFQQRTYEHIKSVKMHDFFQNLVDEGIAIPAPIGRKIVTKVNKPAKVIKAPLDETIVDGVKMVKTKTPQLEGHLVAEPIAKHLDMVQSMISKDDVAKGILGVYDKLLGIWKGSVTGWFPAFHTRNFLGGMFNNWLAGLKSPKWYLEGDKLARGKSANKVFTTEFGEKITGRNILREVEDLGVTGAPGMIDQMKTVEEMMRVGAASGARKVAQYPRVGMEIVEDRLRIPLYLYRRLSKGDTPEQAAKQVFKFHFDYAPEAFTAFERNVMRRIIPFYTWTRHNVPLQLEQLVKQPGKYAGLEKFRRNFEKASGEKAQEEKKYLPEWLKEMFVFRLPGESVDGIPRYLQLDLPIEDLNKLPFTESGRREITSLLSPFLKYPIERIANRNLYFGSEIFDAGTPREFQTAKAVETLKYLPNPIKKYLNFKETQILDTRTNEFVKRYEMDALKLHAIRSVLAGRFYSTVSQAEDSELNAWMKLSRILGGVPVRPVDIEEEKYWRLKEQEGINRDITSYLKRRGEIPYKSKTPKMETQFDSYIGKILEAGGYRK